MSEIRIEGPPPKGCRNLNRMKKFRHSVLTGPSHGVRGMHQFYVLWQTWKENFTIARPEIAENFAESVWREARETEEEIVIPKKTWETAIKALSSELLAREKFDYERYVCYVCMMCSKCTANAFTFIQLNTVISLPISQAAVKPVKMKDLSQEYCSTAFPIT